MKHRCATITCLLLASLAAGLPAPSAHALPSVRDCVAGFVWVWQQRQQAVALRRGIAPPPIVRNIGSLAAAAPSRPAAFPRGPIRVTVWNIHKQTHPEALAKLREIRDQSDLLLIQEARWNASFEDFMGRECQAGRCWEWNGVGAYHDPREIMHGVNTGANVAPTRVEGLRTPLAEPLVKTPKSALASWFKLEGAEKELLVVNVHALNFTGNRSFAVQLRQVEEMIAGHQGPILFAGDFNTWRPARMNLLKQMAKKYGLEHQEFPGDSRRLKLDHVFTRGLKMNKGQIGRDIRASDHFPISFEVEAKD